MEEVINQLKKRRMTLSFRSLMVFSYFLLIVFEFTVQWNQPKTEISNNCDQFSHPTPTLTINFLQDLNNEEEFRTSSFFDQFGPVDRDQQNFYTFEKFFTSLVFYRSNQPFTKKRFYTYFWNIPPPLYS